MPDATAAPAPVAEPLLLTVNQAAAALQVCSKTLWSLTRSGRLPVVRINRSVRYDVADVRRFIEASKGGMAASDTPPALVPPPPAGVLAEGGRP